MKRPAQWFSFLLSVLLLLVPLAVQAASSGSTTAAAGSPGQRAYTTGVLTANGTFVVPDNVGTLTVTGCAAGSGGGGGFAVAAQGGGGGGAAGTCVQNMPVNVQAGATLTYVIGTAGTAGAIGTAGGVVNLITTISGLPSPNTVLTISGASVAAQPGTATNGGAGATLMGTGN